MLLFPMDTGETTSTKSYYAQTEGAFVGRRGRGLFA